MFRFEGMETGTATENSTLVPEIHRLDELSFVIDYPGLTERGISVEMREALNCKLEW